MANKPSLSVANQIALLKQRGMLFRDETSAPHFLQNISYYRLKGYWWDMQADYSLHTSCMIYLCNFVTPGHHIKTKILDLLFNNPTIPTYKLGFLNNWDKEPIWR
jgi:hypothetical protein